MSRERSTFVDVMVGSSRPFPGRDISERSIDHWLIRGGKKWKIKGVEIFFKKAALYNGTERIRGLCGISEHCGCITDIYRMPVFHILLDRLLILSPLIEYTPVQVMDSEHLLAPF